MTITSQVSRTIYAGDGGTTSFPTGFKFIENSHVQVILVSALGVETTWVENTQYTLAGAGIDAGGTVTIDTSPTNYTPLSGETLVIRRIVPNNQETDLPPGGPFPSIAVEEALDLAAMRDQQLADDAGRSLRFPVTDDTALDATMPNATDRASKFLAFDGNSEPIAASGSIGGVPTTPFTESLLDDATAAEARTTMGAMSDANNAVTNAKLAQMASGTIKGNIAGATANAADIPLATLLRSYLAGLTLSAAGATATFGVAAGTAANSTNVSMLALASAYTKTTSAWAVGTGNGAIDTGTIANNTWYHVYLIQRIDTGVVDVVFSTSVSTPTLPANYTLFRRIGAMRTNGSAQWIKFAQNCDEFLWDVMVGDVAVSNLGTTGTLYTLTVPTGVKVNALMRGSFTNAAIDVGGFISSPDESDQVVSVSAGRVHFVVSVAAKFVANAFNIRTNTSAQIRAVSDTAGSSLNISTYGWTDRRGKDS